ncbi:MAG: TraR/DksA family transcriptional regulator [Thiohalophilus sp.]
MSDHAEYRQALLAKRRELLERVTAIADDKQRPASADSEEQAVELENEEVLSALDEEARAILNQIDQALQRMEQGEYGLCRACGKPIAPARLKAIPHAALCIDCAGKQESG